MEKGSTLMFRFRLLITLQKNPKQIDICILMVKYAGVRKDAQTFTKYTIKSGSLLSNKHLVIVIV